MTTTEKKQQIIMENNNIEKMKYEAAKEHEIGRAHV